MKLSQQSLSIIESAIQKAVAKYVCSCEQTVVTDIHLQPDQASGQLNIYNDDDEELDGLLMKGMISLKTWNLLFATFFAE